MNLKMIYHTPELHKLVEAIARVCYQSYGKLSPTSHTMIKSIMSKGHLSVASSGNIVFEVDLLKASMEDILIVTESLLAFKEINNFVRWTTPSNKGSRQDKVTISMNMLSFLDIVGKIEEHQINLDLANAIVDAVTDVPYLHWFLDSSVEVPPTDSPYIGNPTLDNPVILTQDYTALKALGLTDYELDIHSTITVDLITDRATGLQMWRHGDMTGGCELSQRYCDRSNAVIREMEDIDVLPAKLAAYAESEDMPMADAEYHYQSVVQSIRNRYKSTVDFYADINDTLKELGVSAKRAKEIARSVLPNAMSTRIIQCRPLRQWKHFINLRDSVHAQPEIRKDTEAIKKAFDAAGVLYK